MSGPMLEKILDAESKSAQSIKDAENTAKQIIADAESKAAEIIKAAQESANKASEEAIAKAEALKDKTVKDYCDRAVADSEIMLKEAMEKAEVCQKIVVEQIIG